MDLFVATCVVKTQTRRGDVPEPLLPFFLAHAVRAPGSDGHQNVLWSVNYSQVAREQVKCKKPDVFRLQKQKQAPKHWTPTQHEKTEDIQKTKWNTTLSERWNPRSTQYFFTTT